MLQFMPRVRLLKKAMKTRMETQNRRSRTAISMLVLSMFYPNFSFFKHRLLTTVTDIALAVGVKRSLAAFASASTTWGCESVRSS